VTDPVGGARLRLERVGLARARALAAGDLSGVDPAPGWPHDDTLDAVRMDAEHASTDEETGFLAVLVDTGLVVGDGGWKGGPDGTGTAEIGYGLAAPYRGRGLGTELVGLVSAWASGQPGVIRLSAEVLVGNEPSQRALLRNGFTLVGRRDDLLLYARDNAGEGRSHPEVTRE
jgi:[ribosomal protein S5]-alanine N-acetyltransferase